MPKTLKSRLLFILLIINGLTALSLAADDIKIVIRTTGDELHASYHDGQKIYNLRNGELLQINGAPQLPYKIERIALPEGTRLGAINVEGQQISDFANQPAYPWFAGDIKTDADEIYVPANKSQDIYGSNELFPGKYYDILNEGSLGPQPIITVAFYPVQIRPVTGEIILVGEISLIIKTETDNSNQRFTMPFGASLLKAQVANPNQFSARSDTPPVLGRGIPGSNALGIGAEYLIITSGDLAPAFYPYLVWKNQKGLLSELVLIEDILSTYQGVDNPAKLRAYLTDAYNAGARWALLGGDEDIIPIRYAYPANVSSPPGLDIQQICDLYYADLSGDWDYDHDGVYGEMTNDRADLLPEIYVGRIPAENVNEASIWVDKALLYEQNPAHGDYAYLMKALFISADQMRDLNEHVNLAQTMPSDFMIDITRCVEQPSGSSNTPTQPTGIQVISTMDEGWGFVSNLNHGNFYSYSSMAPGYNNAPRSYVWGDTLGPYDGASSLTHLQESDKYSIYYSISCDNAAFDFDKEVFRPGPFITNHTFMEAYLFAPNRAGVAYFGNTRWGWVSASYTLEMKFLQCIFADSSRHLGQAEAFSKLYYPTYRDIDYGHNLFGDPEMVMWKYIPQNLSIVVPSEIAVDSTSITVLVTNPHGPAINTNVCVWKPGELYYRGLTDGSGRITVPISIADPGQMYVTANAIDFIPRIDTIIVLAHSGIDDKSIVPGETYLGHNYPNPFNSTTAIRFAVSKAEHVAIDIFDLGGRKVTTLADGQFEAGHNSIAWNGQNAYGATVASGTYIYKLKTEERQYVQKMVLLK